MALTRFVLIVVAVSFCLAGCNKPASPAPTTAPSAPTIASLVPAATDMILQMGCRDQLVGVSNYDPNIPELDGIARVGDYHNVDWEKLSQIRPSAMVIARPKEEIAPVFRERAQACGITLLPVHSDRIDDIYPIITQLGTALSQPAKAAALSDAMHQTFNAITRRVGSQPPVRTLIVLDETAKFIAGPRNFLDDSLRIAGGINVAADLQKDYPTIDREKLLALNPDAIIQLMPDAPPQVLDAARRHWQSLSELSAVRNNRVYIHSESYLLLPSTRVADVAQLMANDLHPLTAASQPTTTVAK